MKDKIEENTEVVLVTTGKESIGMSTCGIYITRFVEKELLK